MEKSLQDLIGQSPKQQSKAKLLVMLTSIYDGIGADNFGKVSGIQKSELESLSKTQLVEIVMDIREAVNTGSLSEDVAKMAVPLIDLQNQDADSFSTSNATDSDFVTEIGSIDFSNIISGPLNACATAQANASMSTVHFIQEVGFTKNEDGENELLMVDFSHKKKTKNPNFGKNPDDLPDGTNVEDEFLEEEVVLEVPFIALLNVPSLRIENCDIDFNVKLNSVYTKNIKSDFSIDASLGIDYKFVKFDVSASYQRSVSTGVKIEKEYTLGVKVSATNDQLPGGLENVLGILAG